MKQQIKHEHYSLGILGCGDIAHRYATVIKDQIANASIGGVWDIDSYSMQKFAEHFQVDQAASLEAFLRRDFSLICICTPNHTHSDLAKACISNNNNIILEHPLATSLPEAKEICSLVKSSKATVFVTRQRRYLHSIQFLKAALTEQALGPIQQVTATILWNRNEAYFDKRIWRKQKKSGGVIMNQASHFLDLLIYLFGEPNQVKGSLGSLRHYSSNEDSAFGSIAFPNDLTVDFSCSVAAPVGNNVASLKVVGEQGVIQLGGKGWEKIAVNTSSKLTPEVVDLEKGTHNDYIRRTLSHLAGKSVEVTDADEGLKAVKLIDKIYADFDRNDVLVSKYFKNEHHWTL